MSPERNREAPFVMAKSTKSVFSKVRAVKANARAVVGTPPPQRVLPDPKKKRSAPRPNDRLVDLLTPEVHEGDNR